MRRVVSLILCILILLCTCGCTIREVRVTTDDEVKQTDAIVNKVNIDDFDLAFLKLENKKDNIIYSPLSIRYCLTMLKDAASGESKKELGNVLTDRSFKKYTNSENLSVANLFMVKDTIARDVDSKLLNNLKDKYDAELIKDSFSSPDNINRWIEDKTFGQIKDYLQEIDPELLFAAVNALAIDMEWVNKIQQDFYTGFYHEAFNVSIYSVEDMGYEVNKFNGKDVETATFATVANKYDIINELGEDNIRKIVSEDYRSFLEDWGSDEIIDNDIEKTINEYADEYIEDIKNYYTFFKSSTDYLYYVDDDYKVFAKDLKEYDGTTLQYVAILPKNKDLKSFVANTDAQKLNSLIDELKEPAYEDFEEGYITQIDGYMPRFEFEYDLDLDNDLKQLGINKMFDFNDDFNSITKEPVEIVTSHKSKIALSNDGIKAAAVTMAGGLGATGYNYVFDVPTKIIDLRFDKPFLFLIRDKDTNEVLFIGTLYEAAKMSLEIIVKVDSVRIRSLPSTESEKIAVAKKYDMLIGTGNTVEAEGYTWYELQDGGWIADKNGEWLNVHDNAGGWF